MNLLEVDLEKLISILGTDIRLGLTGEQVLRNRREFGENELVKKRHTASSLAGKIFGDVMMIIFLVTGLFDYLTHHNAVSLICVIFASLLYAALVFGSFAYIRGVEARILPYASGKVHVRRNGRIVSVLRSELVPGDILILEKGDVIPCDGVVLAEKDLFVLEASGKHTLTPSVKHSHSLVSADDNGVYRDCLVYAGSVVLAGGARVFVCNTGENIVGLDNRSVARQAGEESRIFKLVMSLKKEIMLIWVFACFIIFAWGVFRGQDVFSIFYYGVAMVVAAFPSSVEYFCSLSGAYMRDRLFRAGAILRDPSAVDRMCDVNRVFVHSADFLFHDKPLAATYFIGDKEYDFRADHVPAKPLLEDMLLSEMSPAYLNDPRHKDEKNTENVILSAAARCGLQKRRLERDYLHIKRVDPDGYQKLSRVLVMRSERYRLIVRGDPRSVLALCTSYRSGPDDLPLTEGMALSIRAAFRRLAGNCERFVAVAELSLSSPPEGDLIECCKNMTYMGVLGLSTPVSASASEAINGCAKAGIHTYLLTDDYPETVESLAKSVSIIREGDYPGALRYESFLRMDHGVFVADVEQYKAFCRFPAEEKRNVISCHKKNGNVTLSLTDTSRDILPQMEADVSVASLGERSPALRLNADVLTRDKDFDLVPLCIRWSRLLYQNVVHILQFLILLQVSLFFSVFLSLALNRDTVLPLPAMLLAGLGAALPCVFNIYHRRPGPGMPRKVGVLKNRINSLQLLIIMPALAGLMGAAVMTLSRQITLFSSGSSDAAGGAALLTFVFSAWFASLSLKTEGNVFRHLHQIGKTGLVTLLGTILAAALAVFSPFAALYNPSYEEFGSGLTFATVFLAILLSLFPMLIMEFMKYLKRDRRRGANRKKREKKEAAFFKKLADKLAKRKKTLASEEKESAAEEIRLHEEPEETPLPEEAEEPAAEETTVENDLKELLAIIQKTDDPGAGEPNESEEPAEADDPERSERSEET